MRTKKNKVWGALGNSIKLLFAAIALFTTMTANAQNRTITGMVVDGKNTPINKVTVSPVGSSGGTATSVDGKFSLTVNEKITSLNFSSVGYITQKVSITNNMLVVLSERKVEDESVIVTGLKNVKRSQFSTAATKILSEDINYVPVASFDQILQGKAPGLLVTTGSGQPGSAARVQIRGASSINGGNAPLYIIDGMPVEAGVFQSINANDFERVDVLRDAISTALYGNRGANGVIVATTKKGKAGKLSVSYNGQYGFTQPGQQKFEMMNSAELLKFQETLGSIVSNGLPGWSLSNLNPANAGLSVNQLGRNAFVLDSLRGINTNWQNIFQQDGRFQSHDINLSSGSGGTSYFLSGGYYKEDGIGLRSDLERYTVRGNIDSKNDRLTVSFRSTAGYTKRNFIESEGGVALANPFAAAYLALPYHSLNKADGKINVGAGQVGPNAYDRINTSTSFNNQIKLLSSLSLNYDINKNIYVGVFQGVDYRVTDGERSIFPNTFASNNTTFPVGPNTGGTIGGGSFSRNYGNFFQSVTRATAGYRRTISTKHDLDVQLTSEYTREKNDAFSYTGYGISEKLLNTPAGITPGTVGNALIPAVGGGKTGRALYGAVAIARYTFDNKYTFTGSLRRDASSQLPVKNRWATFYSAGLNWNVLKEGFAQNWNVFNQLKVSATYGTSANADGFSFGNFGYLATYGNGSYAGQQTIVPAGAGNPDVKWEQIATANLGVDFTMIKNKLRGSFNIYEKTSTDGIVTQTLPAESGFGSQPVNAAKVSNKGLELNLNFDVIKTNDLTFTIGGNIAYNKNEVKSLGQVNEFEQGTSIIRVGLPLGSHYAVKWGGVDAATGAPLYYKKDGTLTNVFSATESTADFGTFNAPWIGGFTAAVSTHGFDLEALFTFQKGFSRFNNQDFFQLNHAFAVSGYNLRKEMSTMWTKPGQVTDIQSPNFQRQFVSKDIQDASFTRLRTLTASYTVNKILLNKLKYFNNIRFYIQGQNLFTWTKWTGFDPEDNNNIAQYEYPLARTINFGVNVSLK